MRVSHRGGVGHELALCSEGNGELVEDPQLGSGSVPSTRGKDGHFRALEGGWMGGVLSESVCPS